VGKWTIRSWAQAPVPPEAIFAFYVDPTTWGSWGHNTRWARARGPIPVQEGSIVDVKAGYGKVYPVLMRRVVADRYVECEIHSPAGSYRSVYPGASRGLVPAVSDYAVRDISADRRGPGSKSMPPPR
jgi:hypothetical protein